MVQKVMGRIIIKLRVKLALYFLDVCPTLSCNFLMAKVKREKYVTRRITCFRGKQTDYLGVTWFFLALRPESNVSLRPPSGDPMGCGEQCPQTHPIGKSTAKDAQLLLMKPALQAKSSSDTEVQFG